MTFPGNDQHWVETVRFLKRNSQVEDRLVAPDSFSRRFAGQVLPYTSVTPDDFQLTDRPFQWVVIHKGMMEAIDYEVLTQAAKLFKPVFANEVFVVLSENPGLPPADPESPHLISFHETLKQQDSLDRRWQRFSGKAKVKLKSLKNQLNPRRPAVAGIPVSSTVASSPAVPARVQVYMGDYKALTQTIWGHKMYVDTRDLSLAPHILVEGYWEMWVTKFIVGQVKEGMTIVEVGTNIGYYSVLLTAKIGQTGRFYGFEANPEVYETLFRNLAVNGLIDRATLVNKAVYSQSQTLKFSRLKRHQGSSTILELPERFAQHYMDEVEVIEVPAVSLDDFFADKSPRVDLLKMDAEGSEALIFKGMKKLIKGNPQLKILFELAPGSIHGTGEDPKAFLSELTTLGFHLYRIQYDAMPIEATVEELLQQPHCEVFASRQPVE